MTLTQLPLSVILCGFFLLATIITAFVSVTHDPNVTVNKSTTYIQNWGNASKIFAALFVASVWMTKLSIGPRYTGLILILMLFAIIAAFMNITKAGQIMHNASTSPWHAYWFVNAGISFIVLIFGVIWLSQSQGHKSSV